MISAEPQGDATATGRAHAPALSGRIPGRGERFAVKAIVPLIVLLFVLVTVFWVVFSTGVVVGDSMYPTMHPGEYMLVTRGYRVPVRGDIVSFYEPGAGGRPIEVLKRVVGTAGDIVEVTDGRATVNGRPEPAHAGVFSDTGHYGPVEVPAGTILVLGDNRPVSLDSRVRGPIPLAQVKGRAVAVFMPLWRARLLGR